MSSAKSPPPLTLNLLPSRWFIVGNGCCHLLALLSLAISSLPLPVIVPLGMAVLSSLVLNHSRYGNPHSPRFIEHVSWTATGQWQLRTADGLERPARLLGSYAHPRLMILTFALGRFARRSVLVLPDSADPEEIRRLRVWLRTSSQAIEEP